MKLAIVGTSHLSETETMDARKAIMQRIKDAWKDNIIVEILTGDAKGIDALVREIALEQGLNLHVYSAKDKHWEGLNGFRERNIKIAKDCDEITSIVTHLKSESCYHHDLSHLPHQRTGGCWTMEYVRKNYKKSADFWII